MSNRCQCKKVDGKQCSRDAKQGSNYCWQHLNCKSSMGSKKIPIIKKQNKELSPIKLDNRLLDLIYETGGFIPTDTDIIIIHKHSINPKKNQLTIITPQTEINKLIMSQQLENYLEFLDKLPQILVRINKGPNYKKLIENKTINQKSTIENLLKKIKIINIELNFDQFPNKDISLHKQLRSLTNKTQITKKLYIYTLLSAIDVFLFILYRRFYIPPFVVAYDHLKHQTKIPFLSKGGPDLPDNDDNYFNTILEIDYDGNAYQINNGEFLLECYNAYQYLNLSNNNSDYISLQLESISAPSTPAHHINDQALEWIMKRGIIAYDKQVSAKVLNVRVKNYIISYSKNVEPL